MTTAWDPWSYRDQSGLTAGTESDLVGYEVEARDGRIGKVDEATDEVGSRYVVVDTGPWIFGKKVLLPAGTIERVDVGDKKVYVDRTKDEIKDSPKFDEKTYTEPDYRSSVGDYYGRYYGGY